MKYWIWVEGDSKISILKNINISEDIRCHLFATYRNFSQRDFDNNKFNWVMNPDRGDRKLKLSDIFLIKTFDPVLMREFLTELSENLAASFLD